MFTLKLTTEGHEDFYDFETLEEMIAFSKSEKDRFRGHGFIVKPMPSQYGAPVSKISFTVSQPKRYGGGTLCVFEVN